MSPTATPEERIDTLTESKLGQYFSNGKKEITIKLTPPSEIDCHHSYCYHQQRKNGKKLLITWEQNTANVLQKQIAWLKSIFVQTN